MLNYHIIKSILSEPWAIDPIAIDNLSPLVASLFTPNMAFEASAAIQPFSRSFADPATGTSKTVQVIVVAGALTKADQNCGPVGMATIGGYVQKAINNAGIDAMVIVFDTPGGTVAGTEDLSSIIKSSSKPIVAYIEDMACSAGMWLASSCREIVANNSTAQVGSIGVLMSFADAQPMWEKQGIKFHTLSAPQSTDKTKTFDELRAGNYDGYKNDVLAPLAQKFIDAVTANRPGIKPDQLTGKVYFAKDAIGSFVDAIGNLDFAIERAIALSSGTSNNQRSPKILNMNYNRLAKVAGVEAFESIDGTIALTGDMAAAVETALESAEADRNHLEERTAELGTANGTVQTLTARVAELEAAAGSGSATIIPPADNGATSGSFWDRLASCREHLNNH